MKPTLPPELKKQRKLCRHRIANRRALDASFKRLVGESAFYVSRQEDWKQLTTRPELREQLGEFAWQTEMVFVAEALGIPLPHP
jgi:hypothetical protein